MSNTKYTVRENKTFANYRAKAIVLINDYRKYERNYCGTLHDDVVTLQKRLAPAMAKMKEATEFDLMTPEFLDLVMKQNELMEKQAEAKEMFLIENDFKNAKTLCGIYYTDCELDIEQYENYGDLLAFLIETIDAFFLKQRSLSDSVSNGKKPTTTK